MLLLFFGLKAAFQIKNAVMILYQQTQDGGSRSIDESFFSKIFESNTKIYTIKEGTSEYNVLRFQPPAVTCYLSHG